MAAPEIALTRGRYRARQAAGAADVTRAQALRSLCFRTSQPDRDDHDDQCTHVLVEDLRSGALVCCFRLMVLENGHGLARSYSAQAYDLAALARFPGRMVEMGRFCIHPESPDPDILRIAWGAMAAFVDAMGVQLLFGCSSFAGTAPEPYLDTFARLQARHLAPGQWRPGRKAPEVVCFATGAGGQAGSKEALLRMPPLLRSYLMMGGWVSDHAVVDRDLNTLHVFTGLDISAVPAGRKRLLRAVAGED